MGVADVVPELSGLYIWDKDSVFRNYHGWAYTVYYRSISWLRRSNLIANHLIPVTAAIFQPSGSGLAHY